MARFKGKAIVNTEGNSRPDLFIVALILTLVALAVVLLIWFAADPTAVRTFLDGLTAR